MSTRWQIAAKLTDGRSACIYVHCDGYPDYALTTLQQHYRDQQKIDRLISLGDCSSVGDEIEECETFHGRGEPWEDVCPTYGDDLATVADRHQHGDEEYRYTWDGQQWKAETRIMSRGGSQWQFVLSPVPTCESAYGLGDTGRALAQEWSNP